MSSASPAGAAFTRRFDQLMAEARLGGEEGARAARRAGALALARDGRRAEEALALAAQLDPLDGVSMLALAQLRGDRGDLAGAREAAAAAFQNAIDGAARALAAFALGEIALARGDRSQAKTAFEAAKSLQNEILHDEPGDYDALRHFARACQRLADFTALDEGAHAGRVAHGEALTILEALAQRDDALIDLAEDLAFGCARAGALCTEIGDFEGAQACAEARIGWVMRLADSEPDNEAWRADLADAWEIRAALDLTAERFLKAREAADRALQVRIALAAAAPGDGKRRRALAKAWTRSAEIAAKAGDIALARSAALQARTLREKDTDTLGLRALHDALVLEGDLALKAEDYEPARQAFARACQNIEPHAREDETWRLHLAQAWERLGEVALRVQRFDSARDAFARTRALLGARDMGLEARLLLKEGEAALGAGDMRSARELLSHSCSLRLDVLDKTPHDLKLARDLAVALERLGILSQAAGDPEAARAAWEDELRLAQTILTAIPDDEHAIRFCAVVHSHLATLAFPESSSHRHRALDLLGDLATMGKLSDTDITLRTRLWDQNVR